MDLEAEAPRWSVISMPEETVPVPVRAMPVQESRPSAAVILISRISLSRNAKAPRQGRYVVAQWIGKDDPLLPAVLQVASELLTNAVIHPAHGLGRESIVLRVSRGRRSLLLEVIDPGTLNGFFLPQPHLPAFTSETGRGLGIVAEYAAAWGTYICDAGRRNVWAVLEEDVPATGDARADGPVEPSQPPTAGIAIGGRRTADQAHGRTSRDIAHGQ
ncbi:ATP-binding protein [Sphaerisporangium sp. NPDC051017]|uniref:ATP-binding protein n=1 Tax=Sphaerisporangium sp. NPDC051017 TaxID=3154636 RepID=UPI00342C7360